MGSCISIYLSNRFGRNLYLDICILDDNFTNFLQISEFQKDFEDLLYNSKSLSIYKTNLTLYFYSFQYKYVNSLLQKAEKYLIHFKHINLIGNDKLFDEVVNYLNTIKVTHNYVYTINYLEEHFVLQTKLNLLTSLTKFSFSIPPACVGESFTPQHLEVIKEDLIVVLFYSGPKYYYVPFGTTIGSDCQLASNTHERSVETKFIGTSPIGPKSILSLFKQYIKNFGPFINEYYQMYDYTFDQIIELSKSGNNEMCDILVSDIYGQWSKAANLPPSLLASKFGKIQVPNLNDLLRDVLADEELSDDVTKSLSSIDLSYQAHQMILKEIAPKLKAFKDKIVGIEHFAKSLMLVIIESIAHHGFLRSLIHNCKKILYVGEEFRNPTLCLMVKEKIDYFPGDIECLFSEVSSVQTILGCLNTGDT